jgi:3-polyprenyl-4-hydroxybenzoate decarboxylase
MAQDLRSFLDLVKRQKPDDFQIVSRPVDPAYEITALVVKLEKGLGAGPSCCSRTSRAAPSRC